jgi:hypothetical protein
MNIAINDNCTDLLDEILGWKVIAAINDHVPRSSSRLPVIDINIIVVVAITTWIRVVESTADDPFGRLYRKLFHIGSNQHVRIDVVNGPFRRIAFRSAHGLDRMDDLSLQIGFVNGIPIDNANMSHTGGGQVQERWRTQSASANHEHRCLLQGLLALDANVRQDQMSGVAADFVIRQ